MNNIKEMDRKTTEMERKVKKIGKKIRFYGLIACILLGFGLAFYLFYKVSAFYDENRVLFQFPIKFQAPVRIEKRVKEVKNNATMPVEAKKKVEKPVVAKSEFEIIINTKYGDILWKIYQLETQRGLTDGCRIRGNGFGGFGVMNEGEVICYPTFEKAVERASFWLGKLEPEKSLASALCQWNLGQKGLINCIYYQDYISL